MSGGEFRRDIQGLRALAVLLVILFHAQVPGFTGGFVGVDVFFVISGYVIGLLIFRELRSSGSFRLRQFVVRRARRLLPALFVVIMATLVMTVAFLEIGEVQSTTAHTALAATFAVSNLQLYRAGTDYFAVSDERNPLLHTWSLGVEEQFYIAIPLLIVLLSTLSKHTRWKPVHLVVASLVTICAGSLLLSVSAVTAGDERLAFYSPLHRFWEIAVGIAIAATVTRCAALLRWLALPAIATLLAAATLYDSRTSFPGIAALPVVAATGVLIVVLPHAGRIRAILESSVMVWIGDRSYGWYLWHWPLMVLAKQWFGDSAVVLLTAGLVALIPTAASMRWLERPMRSGTGTASGRRILGAVAATMMVLVASSAVVQWGAGKSWGLDLGRPRVAGLASVNACHGARYVEPSTLLEDRCTFMPDSEARGIVVLVGDSHASAMADGIVEALVNNQYAAVVTAQPSCPFIPIEISRSRVGAACDRYRNSVWERIGEIRPVAVVMVHDSAGYLNRIDRDPLVATPSGQLLQNETAVISAWQRAMQVTKRELDLAGVQLISVDVIPTYADSFAARAPTLFRPRQRELTLSLADLNSQRAAMLAIEHEILEPGHSIDSAETLCTHSEGCSTHSSTGNWRYADETHLNRTGSLELASHLGPEFRRILPG